MQNRYIRKRIPACEVEELIKKGKMDSVKVGMFIFNIVGKHKKINDLTASRYLMTYDDLVSEGSLFVFKYIHRFNPKRARITTYIYRMIDSYLKVLEKRMYRVRRRIPPNKLISYDVLAASDDACARVLYDPRSIRGMFMRMLMRQAQMLFHIHSAQLDARMLIDKLLADLVDFPNIKTVLELYYRGYDEKRAKAEVGKEIWELSQKELSQNLGLIEKRRLEYSI